ASKRSDQFAGTTWPGGAIITLNAGTQYYIEAVHHQGSGGDGLAVTYKLVGDPDPANGTSPRLAGAAIGTFAYNNAFITITNPPKDAVSVEGGTATFSVGAGSGYLGDTTGGAPPPLLYQWQSTSSASNPFADIAGATATSYL